MTLTIRLASAQPKAPGAPQKIPQNIIPQMNIQPVPSRFMALLYCAVGAYTCSFDFLGRFIAACTYCTLPSTSTASMRHTSAVDLAFFEMVFALGFCDFVRRLTNSPMSFLNRFPHAFGIATELGSWAVLFDPIHDLLDSQGESIARQVSNHICLELHIQLSGLWLSQSTFS